MSHWKKKKKSIHCISSVWSQSIMLLNEIVCVMEVIEIFTSSHNNLNTNLSQDSSDIPIKKIKSEE